MFSEVDDLATNDRASKCVLCVSECVEVSGGEEEEDEAGSRGWEEE